MYHGHLGRDTLSLTENTKARNRYLQQPALPINFLSNKNINIKKHKAKRFSKKNFIFYQVIVKHSYWKYGKSLIKSVLPGRRLLRRPPNTDSSQ